MTPDRQRSLIEAARAALPVETPSPIFSFEVAFADDYADLLAGRIRDRTGEPGALRAAARENGRVLLSAEAGAGKSSVALRAIGNALDNGLVAIRIDLRRWSKRVHERWKALRGSDARRMKLLLECLADTPTTERELRRAGSAAEVLLVVDGLNEVPPSATRELLWVLDAFAARSPWSGVLVCDRLQRRALPSGSWGLATITGVAKPGTSTGPDNALLLDIDRSDDGVCNEARILRDHLSREAELGINELERLDEAALSLYERYKDGQGRFFEIDALRSLVGEAIVDRLRASHELRVEDGHGYFRHHLFHDALAAGAVARDDERWTRDGLDALTFAANSFDAVALAAELIDSSERADRFVMAVYDWSLYAAAYAVSQGRRHGSIAVSPSTELALLAVLAERRWDPVAPSVEKVEDALRVSPSPIAAELLAAESLDEVITKVRDHADTDATWLPAFAGESTPAELIASLDGGPVEGWIAANALRRHELDEDERLAVLAALSSTDGTVRWRAAHTLGSDRSDEAVQGLLDVLDRDDWHWARYGAVRALVEIAASDDTRRAYVLSALKDRLETLQEEELVFRELQSALQLRDPPIGWATAVAPLIEQLFVRAETVPDQDHWRRVGHRISQSVSLARSA